VGRPSSASEAKSQAQTLILAAQQLSEHEGDVAALAAVCAVLDQIGQRPLQAKAFTTLAVAAREDGQFSLAAFAAATLDRLGDSRGAKSQRAELAKTYGHGSTRVDPKRRARPPAAPERGRASGVDAAGDAAVPDLPAALKRASAALARAETVWSERAAAAAPVPAVALVVALGPEALTTLLALMKPSVLKAGDVIVDVGAAADALYLIARGQVVVSRGDDELGRLGAGAFFGEIALLSGTRRTARVTCHSDVWLLEVPRPALESAAAKAPALADVLARHARTRLLSTTMRTSEVFRCLDAADRDALIPRFEPKLVAPGTKVIRSGEEGDRLHVVVSGELEVKSGTRVLGQLGPGDVFGEMSLLGRRPAAADVVARARTVTLSLGRERFDDIAVKHPTVLAEVYKLLIEREAKNKDASTTHEITPDDIVV
jgi:CRP-like cAMP-binding protein